MIVTRPKINPQAILQVVQAVQVASNINWKGVKTMLDFFKREGVALFIAAIVALIGVVGGGVYLLRDNSGKQARIETLERDLLVAQGTINAERASATAREAGRKEAEAEYARRTETLSEALNSAPAWTDEKLPESVREAVR